MTILAIPLPNGQTQFVDENGAPYAGGFVSHYYPGGLNPKDTYQDAEATILNANPLTLDSAGRATIFASGQVRQILQDAALNTIWDQVTVGLIDVNTTATACITYVIDGHGSTITTGVAGDLYVPFACTITAATLLADQSGSIVVDVWKDIFANYPPTGADSITASAKPTITTATNSQDTTLTGWTTTIAAGDTLRFNVNSVTTITRATIALTVTKNL